MDRQLIVTQAEANTMELMKAIRESAPPRDGIERVETDFEYLNPIRILIAKTEDMSLPTKASTILFRAIYHLAKEQA